MNPTVSVVMITYGHENYIREAIEGIFIQKTDFPVEFIIANDSSPDNSDEIIKDLIKKAPENITVKYTRHEKNLGMMPNFVWALQQAEGKYIALCEGDDYWIDESKLQKQVDFLETNLDFSVSTHNVKILKEKLYEESPFDKTNLRTEYSITDLASGNIFPTVSIVAKNIVKYLPNWLIESPFGDYPFLLTAAKEGKIHYNPEKMAVYRENVGVWSGKKRPYQKIIDAVEKMKTMVTDQESVNNLSYQQKNYRKIFLLTLPLKEAIRNKNFLKLGLKDKAIIVAKKIAQ